MLMSNRAARHELAATLFLLAMTSAGAQPAVPADPLAHIAPHERRAYVQQLIARQQAARVGPQALDTTGPVLTAFNAVSQINLGQAEAKFKITVKATDDKSGVQGAYFYATGPSGQTINAYAYPGYPAKSVNMIGGFSSLSRMLEPGAWKFTYGYVFDVAGHYAYIDEAMLDALGNTTFTVVNNSGYDLTKPALVSGKVITPAVSLSSHQPGTNDKDRYVGASLTATDAGNTALAGIKSGSAVFCQLGDTSKCINLYGSIYATGLASVTFTVGRQVSAAQGNVVGTYELYYVYVYDHAQNYLYLYSDKFGGTTDFTAMFPSTVITLNP